MNELENLKSESIENIDTSIVAIFFERYGLKISSLNDLNEIKKLCGYVEDLVKESFMNYSNKTGERHFENEFMSLSIKDGYERRSIDSKALKKDMPDVYAMYERVSTVKPSVVINYKDED